MNYSNLKKLKTIYISESREKTIKLGSKITNNLKSGITIILTGELGSGKTTLTQGIGKNLEIKNPILSPSFTLINFYKGKSLNLCHIDLYKINSEDEFHHLGLDEYFTKKNIVVIEWGEKFINLIPKPMLNINIKITKELKRSFEINHD